MANKKLIFLALIILFAVFVRFYKLAVVPAGMTWDEAAIGYNGYAILNSRRDEWLEFLPISFRSFGDYKAPLAIYLSGATTFLFDLNLWSLRLPFAVFGVFGVLAIYFLVQILFQESKINSFLSLFASLLLASSAWHLHFSRTGFESSLALFFVIAMSLFHFLWLDKKNKNTWKSQALLLGSALFASLSLYSYHSSKIFTPLIWLFLWIITWFLSIDFSSDYKDISKNTKFFSTDFSSDYKNVSKNTHKNLSQYLFSDRKWGLKKESWHNKKNYLKHFLFSFVFVLLFSLPLIYDSFWGEGLTRASSLYISKEIPISQKLDLFVDNFKNHLSIDFLLFGKTDSLRHGPGEKSVFSLYEFMLFSIALLSVLWTFFLKFLGKISARISINTSKSIAKFDQSDFFKLKYKYQYQVFAISIFWIIAGLLPAVLGDTSLHPNRSLLALPGFLLLAVLGVDIMFHTADNFLTNYAGIDKKKFFYQNIINMFGLLLIIVHLTFFSFYFNHYYSTFAKESDDDWSYGYIQVYDEIYNLVSKNHGSEDQIDRVLFSSEYGQPYIYALFTAKTHPLEYQAGALARYLYLETVGSHELEQENTLLVVTRNTDLDLNERKPLVVINDQKGNFKFGLMMSKKR